MLMSNLFESVSSVFRPYVASMRSRPELADQPVAFRIDSVLRYMSERVPRLLGRNHVIALTCPAHTMNLFQARDLVFFGALKHVKATATGAFHDEGVNDEVTTIVQAYEQTATSATIR
jgi:hypothetical protein